jgi:hypothetical protein
MSVYKMSRAEIEKIVEEAHKRVAQRIVLNIPSKIPSTTVGNFVAKEIKKKYDIPLASPTTSNINVIAVRAEKEKMRLDKIVLQLGTNWLPLKVSFEWTKKK